MAAPNHSPTLAASPGEQRTALAVGSSGWTEQRIDLLKKLWADGLSATQIAKQMGGVSRNAVLGKAWRSGLTREHASRPTRRAALVSPVRRASAPKALKPAKPLSTAAHVPSITFAPVEPLPERDEAPGAATVLTLGAHMCKWPIGDPAAEDFTLCGRRADRSYCVEHAQLAYQPPKAKKPQAPGKRRESWGDGFARFADL